MMLQGVQSFIHLKIASLELGCSWGPVVLPVTPLPEAAQPQCGKPKAAGKLFWRRQEVMLLDTT